MSVWGFLRFSREPNWKKKGCFEISSRGGLVRMTYFLIAFLILVAIILVVYLIVPAIKEFMRK